MSTPSVPIIPPRPLRKVDPSPDRYSRSPLNGPAFATPRRASEDRRTSSDLPRRPPSVSLPLIGQEGSEYSSYDQLPSDAHGVSVDPAVTNPAAGEQQKSVSPDLPMHQPVASVPKSTAKRQIESVTRTDSTQAAAAGFGKAPSAEDAHESASADPALTRATRASEAQHPLRAQASFNRSTSSLQPMERSSSRPGSVHGGVDYEHGIPHLGQQVPLLAYAGDVQAPSPAPGQSAHTPGIGFFNDGSTRHHNRRRSSRQEFQPHDVYGLRRDHDHQDKFEKAWVAKHPVEAAKEEHYAHLPRPESAMSSEQLNRLVHQQTDVGFGTSGRVIGTPDEQVAFDASQEYISRMSTPQASPAKPDKSTRQSSGPQATMELPSRRISRQNDHALESEDEGSYHLQPSARRTNKVTGGGDVDNKLNLGPYAEDGGYVSERAEYTPILASDEIIKRPGSAYMQAAIEPGVDRNPDEYYDSDHGQWSNSRRNSVNPPSRPSSRPSSVHGNISGYHGGSLHRYTSHEEHAHSGMGTPLEEIEEYEPLFPEDDKGAQQPKKIFKKRPDLASHHFPSQDTWEDNPSSLEYSATVSTPELDRERAIPDAGTTTSFETPAQEQSRREQNPNSMLSNNKTYMKPHFKPGVQDEVSHRPGVQRFPSSDVWEDSPESFNLTTTVSGPQLDEARSPPDETPAQITRPLIPARPEKRSKLAQEVPPAAVGTQEDDEQMADSAEKARPGIPARPVRAPQAGVASNDSAPKSKPVVPPRPGGSKIAALQAGFMNDLNNRLKLGPQGPPPKKEPEIEATEEAEKAPLADARKGRAKGPPRRKPASSTEAKKSSFAFSPLITVWTIDEEDEVQVQPESKERAPSVDEANVILAANESENMKEPLFSPPPGIASTAAAEGDGEAGALPESAVGFEGDKPDPKISSTAVQEQKALQADFETALKEAEVAPKSFESRVEKHPESKEIRTPAATAVGDADEDQASRTEMESVRPSL